MDAGLSGGDAACVPGGAVDGSGSGAGGFAFALALVVNGELVSCTNHFGTVTPEQVTSVVGIGAM